MSRPEKGAKLSHQISNRSKWLALYLDQLGARLTRDAPFRYICTKWFAIWFPVKGRVQSRTYMQRAGVAENRYRPHFGTWSWRNRPRAIS